MYNGSYAPRHYTHYDRTPTRKIVGTEVRGHQGPVVQKSVSQPRSQGLLGHGQKQISQQLVYKLGHIPSEILSGSKGVFFSEVLKPK